MWKHKQAKQGRWLLLNFDSEPNYFLLRKFKGGEMKEKKKRTTLDKWWKGMIEKHKSELIKYNYKDKMVMLLQ